ncbi:hypothetical protein GQR58_025809 [Nymphon striatum]|nr:hypothetical protein GQR58_025809 [Nymphon striatum]
MLWARYSLKAPSTWRDIAQTLSIHSWANSIVTINLRRKLIFRFIQFGERGCIEEDKTIPISDDRQYSKNDMMVKEEHFLVVDIQDINIHEIYYEKLACCRVDNNIMPKPSDQVETNIVVYNINNKSNFCEQVSSSFNGMLDLSENLSKKSQINNFLLLLLHISVLFSLNIKLWDNVHLHIVPRETFTSFIRVVRSSPFLKLECCRRPNPELPWWGLDFSTTYKQDTLVIYLLLQAETKFAASTLFK